MRTWSVVRAGELTHRLTIHAPAGTLAVAASDVDTNVPAKIQDLELTQQRERLDLGGLVAAAGYRVLMRYRSDVRMDYILVEECHGLRQLQIISMTQTDDALGLELVCVLAVVNS